MIPNYRYALKGRHKSDRHSVPKRARRLPKDLFRPCRARRLGGLLENPGRCPGLICGCPFGATAKTAQHQSWRFGLVRGLSTAFTTASTLGECGSFGSARRGGCGLMRYGAHRLDWYWGNRGLDRCLDLGS